MKRIHAADTNTNVIPSMHRYRLRGLAPCVFDAAAAGQKLHLCDAAARVIISKSTVFVKQHSMLDVLVAIPVSALLCVLIY